MSSPLILYNKLNLLAIATACARLLAPNLLSQSEGGEDYDFTDLLIEHGLSDQGSSMEEQIEKTKLRSSLQRSLDALQAEHKEILYLVDMLGLDYNEVAEALALPLVTVKSRLAHGRVQLRNHLFMKSLSPDILTDLPNYAGEYASHER